MERESGSLIRSSSPVSTERLLVPKIEGNGTLNTDLAVERKKKQNVYFANSFDVSCGTRFRAPLVYFGFSQMSHH